MMMKISKQLIFALLISSALALTGLAQSQSAPSSYYWQDKKQPEKTKEKEKEPKKDEPKKDDKKDDKKKP